MKTYKELRDLLTETKQAYNKPDSAAFIFGLYNEEEYENRFSAGNMVLLAPSIPYAVYLITKPFQGRLRGNIEDIVAKFLKKSKNEICMKANWRNATKKPVDIQTGTVPDLKHTKERIEQFAPERENGILFYAIASGGKTAANVITPPQGIKVSHDTFPSIGFYAIELCKNYLICTIDGNSEEIERFCDFLISEIRYYRRNVSNACPGFPC